MFELSAIISSETKHKNKTATVKTGSLQNIQIQELPQLATKENDCRCLKFQVR